MGKHSFHYLRYALCNAAKPVWNWCPTIADYLAEKCFEGEHYNVAVSHVAKKLVRLIFAMQKSGKPYLSKS